MAEDITEIKKLEKMLDDQRQTMIEATRLSSLGEMAGGIAHEINTPLAIISAKVSQLIRKITSGSIDEHKLSEDLQIINQTTHRISKIINGLRALSRESENDPMMPYSAELSITNALDLCFEKFRNHQVHISTSLIPKIYYLGRSTQLSQVILNLLNNAFDAIETCTDKWIKIEMQTTDIILMIFITDSGPSIDPAVVAKMMFPFFTTKSVGKGTGLGLSISKGIIEKHGGKLYYDQNSCNTKFVIELPLLIGDDLE